MKGLSILALIGIIVAAAAGIIYLILYFLAIIVFIVIACKRKAEDESGADLLEEICRQYIGRRVKYWRWDDEANYRVDVVDHLDRKTGVLVTKGGEYLNSRYKTEFLN